MDHYVVTFLCGMQSNPIGTAYWNSRKGSWDNEQLQVRRTVLKMFKACEAAKSAYSESNPAILEMISKAGDAEEKEVINRAKHFIAVRKLSGDERDIKRI